MENYFKFPEVLQIKEIYVVGALLSFHLNLHSHLIRDKRHHLFNGSMPLRLSIFRGHVQNPCFNVSRARHSKICVLYALHIGFYSVIKSELHYTSHLSIKHGI